MNSKDLAIDTSSFKEALREKVLSASLGLIPQEKIDALIESEIKAFFYTEQLLTVTTTKIEVDNPKYNPSSYSGYGNERTLSRDALAFGSHMTPFRQLVWTALHEKYFPIVKDELDRLHAEVNSELDAEMNTAVLPKVGETMRDLLARTSQGMAMTMFSRAMRDATATAHMNMMNSLMSVGVNTASIPVPPSVVGNGTL